MSRYKFPLLTAVCLFLILPGCSEAQGEAKSQSDSKSSAKEEEVNPRMKLNASHILIGFKGAERSEATRSQKEALTLAEKIAKEAQANGADFAALARKHSEGPSGPSGGDLGNFEYGRMVPAFSKAAAGLKVGGVSGPVESQFGYHIILRKKLVEDLCAAHILISFKGAMRAKNQRSKDEALKLAKEISAEAKKAGPEKFGDLARKYSEGPSGPGGGKLGTFEPKRMVAEFSKATQAMKINGISEPVESQFGYHIILRMPLPRKCRAKHILVQWKGSARATGITRSQEEAKARIEECLKKLTEGGKFETLAGEYSDGPSGPRGGDLREVEEGTMADAFDAALFKMKDGETSGIVETEFGYHIIYRYKK